MKHSHLPFAMAISASLCGPAVADPAYVVTYIPLEVSSMNAASLNRWGEVSGLTLTTPSAPETPAVWLPSKANATAGAIRKLTGFPVAHAADGSYLTTVLNDRGQVAGSIVLTSPPANQELSYLWTPTVLTGPTGSKPSVTGTLALFPNTDDGNGTSSQHPKGINNRGQILGYGAYYSPMVWTPAAPNGTTGSWVSDPNWSCSYLSINDSGQIGGSAIRLYGVGHEQAMIEAGLPLSLGGFLSSPLWNPGPGTFVAAINQAGDAVVNANVGGLLYKNGAATIAFPGVQAFAINDYDQMIASGAQLYSNGALYQLQDLVPSLYNGAGFYVGGDPIAINDAGQILAFGGTSAFDGAFLLTPAAQPLGSAAKVTRTSFKHAGGVYSATFTVTNGSANAFAGPVRLVFDKLSSGVTVANPDGATAFAPPIGSPYKIVSAAGIIAGGNAQIAVSFNAAAPPAYSARVTAAATP